jgi:hypothetical protein
MTGGTRRRVAVDGPKRTYVAVSPDGRRITRTSNHPYTHAAFTYDDRTDSFYGPGWFLEGFSASEENARKTAQRAVNQGRAVRIAVVPVTIDGGRTRRRPQSHASTPHRHVHGRR